MSERFTWVQAVAGDVGPSQPLGELMGEEYITQFAVAVGLEKLPAEPAGAQVSVRHQSLNTKSSLTHEWQAGMLSAENTDVCVTELQP